MFQHLTDFAYRRTPLQALGFYIVSLALIFAISAAIGAIVTVALGLDPHNQEDAKQLRMIAYFVAIIASIAMASVILHQKRQLQGKGVGMLILTFFLSAVIGGSVSMAVVAYLTTWESADNAKPEEQ